MNIPVRQLLRFGLVGLFNTGVAYSTFALLIFAGLHYTLATFLGGLSGMLVGYKTTGKLVFDHHDNSRIFRFAGVFVLMYALNIAIQWRLNSMMNHYYAGAVATGVCFLLSFALNRRFVFSKTSRTVPNSYDREYADIQIRRSRNPLRRLVRSVYLRDIARFVKGPAIDVGCGAGDLLARLPAGSLGLEINPAAVEFCLARGLEAEIYDPDKDGYRFERVRPGQFDSMIFTHVLEHMDNPAEILDAVFHACWRLEIKRMILTVPCRRGYCFDPTHRTFVDKAFLADHGLLVHRYYKPLIMKYFPFDVKWIGNYYTFHEFRVVFVRRSPS